MSSRNCKATLIYSHSAETVLAQAQQAKPSLGRILTLRAFFGFSLIRPAAGSAGYDFRPPREANHRKVMGHTAMAAARAAKFAAQAMMPILVMFSIVRFALEYPKIF